MKDIFTCYRNGLKELLLQLDNQHPYLPEFLTLEQRLLENLAHAQQFGDLEGYRAERSQIISSLNRLAQHSVGKSFNELCGINETVKRPHAAQPSEHNAFHQENNLQTIKNRSRKAVRRETITTRPYLNNKTDDRASFILEIARYLMKKEEYKETEELISYAQTWFRGHREQIEGYESTVLRLSNLFKLNLYNDLETILDVPKIFVHLSSEAKALLQVVEAVDGRSPSLQRRYLCNDLRRIQDLSSGLTVLFNTLTDEICKGVITDTLIVSIRHNLPLVSQLINSVHRWLSWMVTWFDTLGKSLNS